MKKWYFVYIFLSCVLLRESFCLKSYSKNDVAKLREEVREMFQHAYDGYLKYANKYDELRPLSCDGVDTWGSYSLTLIDALDTLVVVGNYSEFRRVVNILIEKSNFDSDINVSVFETNIRIVGGLLSAHLLSFKAGLELEPGWPCNGPLLRLAEDVAKRLLPAFDTKTGMPFGTVNLRYGVPAGETSVTCTAGVGTFIIEFGALSRLTGDPIFEEVALNALYALNEYKSPIGLFGNHIDVQTGRWTAQDAGIGAGVDSFYEYLVKGSLMLNRPELMYMFNEGKRAIDQYLKKDDWHIWVGMNKGQVTLPVFQSLDAYWPGVLSLLGDISSAMKTLHNYHTVWKKYGFLPEFFNIPNAEAGVNRENYPLRPELIESVMYLYRATGDPYLLEVGEDILRSIQHSAKTPCGYATIKNVRDHQKENRMESFFLAETTKYLYLLFDPDNFINNDGRHGTIIDTVNGECLIDAGGYVFNTEAHPIDPSALRCCYDIHKQSLLKDYSFQKYSGDVFQFESNNNRDVNTMKKTSSFNNENDEEIENSRIKNQENLVEELMKVLAKPSAKHEKSYYEMLSKYTEKNNDTQPNTDPDAEQVDEEIQKEPVESFIDKSNLSLPNEIESESQNLINPVLKSEKDSENIFVQNEGSEQESTLATENDTTAKEDFTYLNNLSIKKVLDTNSSEQNLSIISQLAQMLSKSNQMPRSKFDFQDLLKKMANENVPRNETWKTEYQLLTCNAQPFLQRISVQGEFL